MWRTDPMFFLFQASTDQSAVDIMIAFLLSSLASTVTQLLLIIALMSKVAWEVFVIFVPITAICVWYQVNHVLKTVHKINSLILMIYHNVLQYFSLQQCYIPSARELSRLIGVAKALVIQHFAETISGATTIRSFDQEQRFCETSMKCINGYSSQSSIIQLQCNGCALAWTCCRLSYSSALWQFWSCFLREWFIRVCKLKI